MLQFIQLMQKDLLACYLDSSWPLGHTRLPHLDIEILGDGIFALRPRLDKPCSDKKGGQVQEIYPHYEMKDPKVWDLHKSIVLSAGIHGDETAPIECLAQIAQDILNQKQALHWPCLFIFAHAKATLAHVRYFEQNLNRLFANQDEEEVAAQGIEANIARQIKHALADFYATTNPHHRWHFDLHCSIRPSIYPHFAISPLPIDPKRSQRLHQMLIHLNMDAVVVSNQASSTLSWFSHAFYCAHAATLELGQLKPLGENNPQDLARFETPLRQLLAHKDGFESNRTPQRQLSHPTSFYKVSQVIENKGGIHFLEPDKLINFNRFETDIEIAKDTSQGYLAKAGEIILFANDAVEVGQRAGLIASPLIESDLLPFAIEKNHS